MDWNSSLQGLLTAIGLGLMIGVVRERLHADSVVMAGVRTHTLVALVSAVAAGFGAPVLIAVLFVVGALAIAAYMRTAAADPGLTGEVALLVTALLAALAQQHAGLAAGMAVLTAALLFAKRPLHRFAREVISEQELQDALLLAGAALVVLPLLPDRPIDPWGVLVPSMLWRLVVLVMGVGMLGHISVRVAGTRWGLPVAGFFSGFASSLAAVAGFGHRAKAEPSRVPQAASAALLANLASFALFVAVVAAGAPQLLVHARLPLLAAGVALSLASLFGLRRAGTGPQLPEEPPRRAFRLSHALMFAALVAALLLVSGWLRSQLGESGAVIAAMVVALAELHAAAASIAQLAAAGALAPDAARLGLVGLLAGSALGKGAVAFVTGGRAYGLRVAGGLLAMVTAAAIATIF